MFTGAGGSISDGACATLMLVNGANIRVIQQTLGHIKLTTYSSRCASEPTKESGCGSAGFESRGGVFDALAAESDEDKEDEENAMIRGMEPLHISEGELARDVRSILRRVETGSEVIIQRDAQPVAIIRPAEPVRRKISECIALMPSDSMATIDADFAKDVEAAIAAHR